MGENQQSRPAASKKDEKDLMALLSYLGILFLIPLLAGKDNEFNQFHAKQGLVLFIAEIVTAMLTWIPIIGWIGGPLLYIAWFIFSIIGIVNVLQGEKKELPLIGQLAEKFNS